MYFKEFKQIFYDLPVGGNDTALQVLTDITTNVRVKKEVLSNITLYDEYDIKDGETPEIIAEKYYGNPELHWVVMLVNEKFDYINDFPLTYEELYENTIAKYGEGNLDRIHHYEENGLITQPEGVLMVQKQEFDLIQKDDILQNPFITAKVKSKSFTNNRFSLNLVLEKGNFIPGEILNIFGVRLNRASGLFFYDLQGSFEIWPNSFLMETTSVAVTNLMYEDRENEKKRRIRLIDPSLIQQIVAEFKKLVNE